MKTKTVYVDEVTGNSFDSQPEAEKSENRAKDLAAMFKFMELPPKEARDKGCTFSNGGYCLQHDKAFYEKIRTTIIAALRKYEPGLVKEFAKHGGIENCIFPWGLLGRYLDDMNSPVRPYLNRMGNICPECYREWGQGYYRLHCTHTDKPAEWGL